MVNTALPRLLSVTPEYFGIKRKSGDFGVEIELEGRNITIPVPGWLHHQEGSLRGENVEFVTTRVCSDKRLKESMNCLYEALSSPEREVFESKRTSTHIHLNFSTLPIIDAIGYYLVFTTLEPLLMHTVAKERNGNLFCLTSYHSGEGSDSFKSWLNSLSGRKFDRGKYASLNLTPLFNFGSVECRIFPQSIIPAEVCTWASWLKNMQEVAQSEQDKTYLRFVDYTRTNPENLVRRVFQDSLARYSDLPSFGPNSIPALVQFGCEQTHELSVALSEYIAGELQKPQNYDVENLRQDLDFPAGVPIPFILTDDLEQEGRIRFKPRVIGRPRKAIINGWHYTLNEEGTFWTYD